MAPSPVSMDREKWNARYGDSSSGRALVRPEPHNLAMRWRSRFLDGPMLDAACGFGKGVAGALGSFAPIYAVDVSDVAVSTGRRLFAEPAAGGGATVRGHTGGATVRWV